MKNSKKLALIIRLVWSISPAYYLYLIINSAAFAGQIVGNVLLPKFLIDELTGALRPQLLVFWVLMIAGANLLFTFLKKTMKRLLDVKSEEVNWLIEKAFADKLMSIEFRHLEDPYYLDLKERAQFAARNQQAVKTVITLAVDMVNQGLIIISLMAVMLSLSWILLTALLITIAAMLMVQAGFAKHQRELFAKILPVNRRYGDYVNLSFGPSGQKDIRLYDMSDMIGDRITEYNKDINSWFSMSYRKQGIAMGIYQVITVAQSAIAYGYVGSRTLSGAIGIGSLTMYVSSAIGFSSAVIAFGTAIIGVLQHLSYLDPFAELMNIPEEGAAGGGAKLESVASIRFENVSFTYPKTDKRVLEDISFEINKGQKISIVGLNGAGKSTVVKLLCRLYKPDSGTIYVNGLDIYDYEHKSYLKAVAAVFQDFKLFNFTVEENISCSEAGTDTEKINEIISDVGLTEKIGELPHGLKTLIGKAYDKEGAEFSGGQAQKIAIARALYKDASLLILDEPTSALDPIAESEIYENFNSLVGSKTAIYISHRMSSSVFCDKVLVIAGGRIEAFDTHFNLMKNTESTYYRLFTSQAVNYNI